MKLFFSFVGLAAVLAATGASAAELPTFERGGFPITPLQVAVTGTSDVQEQSPGATLTSGDMPASPHQLAVLSPRHRTTTTASTATMTATRVSTE